MKAIGIQKATRRLSEARSHAAQLERLEGGLNVPAYEREWSLFLSAINSVHEIVKTSARMNPTSRQWVALKDKNEIRKDPLLRYLLHARGADYHGLESGAVPDVHGTEYLGFIENPPVHFTIRNDDGVEEVLTGGVVQLAGDVSSFSFSYKLVPVTDERHAVVFDPPTIHFGSAVDCAKPSIAARLAIDYYSAFLSEAADQISN
jgi:hypothetical protein